MNFLAKIMATTSIVIKKQLVFFCLLLNSSICFGQEYGVIPSDVRAKMNLNKENGLPTYTGVVTAYSVQCEGLDNVEIIELQQRAQQKSQIKSIIIHSNSSVEVICTGGTPFEEIKPIFSSLVSNISSTSIDNRIE